MVRTPSKRIAILIHGFAGKKDFMREIERSLTESPYDQIYDRIANLSYYSSKHGLDFSKPYDLRTPIYAKNVKQTLAHYFFELICVELSGICSHQEEISLDIFAHSMGGLVTRAMIKYVLTDNNVISKKFKRNCKLLVKNVFLLGTPNQGTRLAHRMLTIPADVFVTGLNLVLEIPKGKITTDDLHVLESQFLQMTPGSRFLQSLNAKLEEIEKTINWVTIRGLKWTGQLGMVWQPFLFGRFWIDRHFPFLHRGMIPNDGLVNADSVPLKFAKSNLTIANATHMGLLKWKSKKSGRKIQEMLKPIIVSPNAGEI